MVLSLSICSRVTRLSLSASLVRFRLMVKLVRFGEPFLVFAWKGDEEVGYVWVDLSEIIDEVSKFLAVDNGGGES